MNIGNAYKQAHNASTIMENIKAVAAIALL